MLQESYRVLGVMSGTSLDGIDLALITFELSQGRWGFNIEAAQTYPYDDQMALRLHNALQYSDKQLEEFDKEYTLYLGKAIRSFLDKLDGSPVDAVCSHGHTVVHRPDLGRTLQIGNRPELASIIGSNLVCDFRVQDVAKGGQGAPLVPIGDRLLFRNYDRCLNLGGFANVSFESNTDRLAFDLCPVNVVLNRLSRILGADYDKGGQWAAAGNVDKELLKRLNSLPYYREEGPKSLGMEWVEAEFWPLLRDSNLDALDLLATAVEHMGMIIGRSLESGQQVLITGGGAFNSYLLGRIQANTNAKLVVPDEKLVDYKEALIFGLLGVLRLRGEINVLSSVTGAEGDHSSGKIYMP